MAMDLCGLSYLEVEEFLDDKRTHMSEGIVVIQVFCSLGMGLVMRETRISVFLVEHYHIRGSTELQN